MKHCAPRQEGKAAPGSGHRAFSLAELLVSIAVFALVLVLVSEVLTGMRSAWVRSSAQVAQFRDARLAFELITRHLGQADLNTHYDYEFDDPTNRIGPRRYVRRSDLHFISGLAGNDAPDGLLPGETRAVRPGHCVFFQAHLGHAEDTGLRGLGSLLNGRGYYVQFTDGTELEPNFLGPIATPRWRFRLWEWIPASEKNTSTDGNQIYSLPGNAWFADEAVLGWKGEGTSRLVAENVVALFLSPRASLPDSDDPAAVADALSIAPNYRYDSRSHGPVTSPARFGARPPLVSLQHLLPPLVEVTLVAIDEDSAIRLEAQSASPSTPPEFVDPNAFQDATQFAEDLAALESSLVAKGITYRVFSTTIALRGAKWDATQHAGTP